jgi:tRNA-dihydrouridine synthase A
MMEWTDRHFRYFFRQISKRAILYTEMITAEAIIRGDRSFLLDFSEEEHPVVLQLGGSDPERLAEAARIGRSWGYDAINLNVGCPSPRVQEGRFGACLMAEADLVARCVEKMRSAVDCPVTVKHRIGIDNTDSYEFMEQFVKTVASSGCREFAVHARAAWLQGLSPKENREIPPLRYDDVYRLKAEHPELLIEINGGIRTMEEIKRHLQFVDGVMIGRAAYHHPLFLRDADAMLFAEKDGYRDRSEAEIFHSILDYLERWMMKYPEGRLHTVTRHLMGFWYEKPGARDWRSRLSQISQQTPAQGFASIQEFLKRYLF